MNWEIISLGSTCATKYQIARHQYLQRFPTGDLDQFRRMIFDPTERDLSFNTYLFDWQITPISAIVHCLRTRFMNIFERGDLEITGDSNYVRNRRLGTIHPHSFHPPAFNIDVIDEQYADALAKISHLAGKLRERLADNKPITFVVWGSSIAAQEAENLTSALEEYRSAPFEVIFVSQCPLILDRKSVASIKISEVINKPDDRQWEGDDKEWDRVFSLGLKCRL